MNCFPCDKCIHLNKENNKEIGYEFCSGEYCDYKFVPIRGVVNATE